MVFRLYLNQNLTKKYPKITLNQSKTFESMGTMIEYDWKCIKTFSSSENYVIVS